MNEVIPCPVCDGPLHHVEGGFRRTARGLHPGVMTCLACFQRAGQNVAYGIEGDKVIREVEVVWPD
jgi:hypothetical protein